MQVRLKRGLIVVTAEPGEADATVAWASAHQDHAFALWRQDDRTFVLKSLGLREEACREPINVVSNASSEAVRLISNFAHTPFELDGQSYASVEGFWQGLKFPGEEDRQRIATLHGDEAKRAGAQAPESDSFEYGGVTYRTGCAEHWELMRLACWAKFTQHPGAREALLATSTRPLTHRLRRDSRTIPGVIMAEIWMKTRTRLRRQLEIPSTAAAEV
jgi:predicted NAD-dependent protein-ADP-ribosyltransferase YbiA (DUF1768 family)